MKYEQKKIKDICRFIGGSQPPKSEFVYEPREGYIRLIQTRDRLNDNFITFIPRNSTTKFCETSDILIGRYGPPIFQIFRGFEGAYNVAIMKADPINGVNKDYLYYFLRQDSVLKYVDSMSARTGGQTGVELDSLYEYPVLLPDDLGQKKISSILKCIDDKITNNNKIRAELESMAKTIYDYWFTQFDFPNKDGRPYRSSGGIMEWNDQLKREIPKEWNIGNLYDIAETINGLACQKHRPKENEESLPVVKIKEMHEGITENTELVSVNINKKHKIFDGDILFSWSATLEVMYWFGGDAGLNQHIFKVVPIAGFSKEYVYHQFSAYVINFVKMAESRKTTMGHITTDHLEQSRIVLPPSEIVQAFSEIVAPIHEKIGQCQKENRELIKLRNWLLPMLMNGQATVE